MATAFNFELVSPERLLLSEDVTEVVVPGADGYLTVMANHAPLMTTLKPGVVEAKLASGGEKRIFVRGGFADISGAGFTLLAEQAMNVEDIDTDYLDGEISNAQDDVNDAKSEGAREAAEMRLSQMKEIKAALGH